MSREIPSYPTLFDMPFAANGDKRLIPPSGANPGAATLLKGFPEETARPIDQNGIPPSRLDVNGILHLLSSWAFYTQSGGIPKWDASVNYIVPAMVYYSGIIYTCKANNGPASTGAITPGSNAAYWTPGFGGDNQQINRFGNNANSYREQGIYWVDDGQASANFPTPGVGGWLCVLVRAHLMHQCYVRRSDIRQIWSRTSSDTGNSWSSWARFTFADEFYNGAYTQIFISTATPADGQGKDGDIWFTYR